MRCSSFLLLCEEAGNGSGHDRSDVALRTSLSSATGPMNHADILSWLARAFLVAQVGTIKGESVVLNSVAVLVPVGELEGPPGGLLHPHAVPRVQDGLGEIQRYDYCGPVAPESDGTHHRRSRSTRPGSGFPPGVRSRGYKRNPASFHSDSHALEPATCVG